MVDYERVMDRYDPPVRYKLGANRCANVEVRLCAHLARRNNLVPAALEHWNGDDLVP